MFDQYERIRGVHEKTEKWSRLNDKGHHVRRLERLRASIREGFLRMATRDVGTP